MLLPQDLYILLKLSCTNDSWTYRALSDQLFLSVSQLHAGLKRAESCGLYSTKHKRPISQALEELIVHGVRYVFGAAPGPLVLGMPTSYAAPPLNSIIVPSGSPPPVWPYPEGTVIGYTIEALHSGAPKAALLDEKFYELLCLVDAIREGRVRERKIAAQEIHDRLRNKVDDQVRRLRRVDNHSS